MYVPYKQLVQMMHDAYTAGRTSPSDLRSQAVEEIIVQHKVAKEHDFRIYTVDELRNFPIGTRLCHSLLGNGKIVQKKGMRNPFMKFDSGVTHAFTSDTFPWDMPMLYIGEDRSEA